MKLETSKKIKKMLHASRFTLHEEGFTFVGVVTASFMAVMGLLAIFSLASMTLRSAEVSKMRLIASGLSQEGVEVIRNVRRSYLEWRLWDWYSTTSPSKILINIPTEYCVQYDTCALADSCILPDPDCNVGDPLKFDKVSGLYRYDVGYETPFYRTVTMTRLGDDQTGDDAIKVEVEVKWKVVGRDDWHYLITEDRLWKWK